MVGERGDGGVGGVGWGVLVPGGALVSTHPDFGPPSPSSPNMAAISRFLPFCACDRPDILSRLCDVLASFAAWPGTGSYLGYPVVGLCCPVMGSTSPRHASARAASSTSSSRQREPDECMEACQCSGARRLGLGGALPDNPRERTYEFSRGMVGSAGTCQPAAAARRTQARRRARPAYVRTTPGFAGIAADGHPVTAMVGARRLVGEAVAVAGAPPGLTSLAWPFLQHNCAATCMQSTHDQAWFMC